MSISWKDSSAIDLASSESWEGMEVDNVKLHVDRFVFPDVHRVTVLASSRLLNLGGATGHPPFVVLFVFIYPSHATRGACHLRVLRRGSFQEFWPQ